LNIYPFISLYFNNSVSLFSASTYMDLYL
jgi:hypothetical protein